MLKLRYIQAAIAQIDDISNLQNLPKLKSQKEATSVINKILLSVSRNFEDSDKAQKQIKKILEELSLKKDDVLEKLKAVDTSNMDESQLMKHNAKVEKAEKKLLAAKELDEAKAKEEVERFQTNLSKGFDNLRFLLRESEFKAPRTASEALKALDSVNASNESIMSVLVELREVLEKNVKYLKNKHGIVEQTK